METIPDPILIEPGVKYFLHHTLKQCHITRENMHNFIMNVCIFLFFVFVVSMILLYKYKTRPSPKELEEKEHKKHEYILSKVKMYQEHKKRVNQALITGLPLWENEHAILYS